ncbi:GNAT family N-acetyltransferase [Halobacillus litoralis]|uniref:GNAT family N-acetyltransferase n=1 Tax=Halobacillus litoralis TaxID=45668 RepID=UPI001CFE755E|nr:GNAT family N-acetyltransferase [Halobacillus litoralis]
MPNAALKKFGEADFECYYRLVSNRDVMAQITERAVPLKEAQSNYKKILLQNKQEEILCSYKVINADTNEFVGLGHLTLKEKRKKEAEIGYMLLPEHWGKRYGTYIAEMLVDLAKQTNVTKLKAVIDPENNASRKILFHKQFVSEKVCEMDGLPAEVLSRNL